MNISPLARGVPRTRSRATRPASTTQETHVPGRGETQALFNGAARGYREVSQLLSGGQYLRWRNHLVQRLRRHGIAPGDDVLDVATGTGLIARRIEETTGARVTGADITPTMLHAARREGLAKGRAFTKRLVAADAERLPFPDHHFDAVTTSYLLRYVEDPARVLDRLIAHVRPGGFFGLIEFSVPTNPAWRLLWRAHTRIVLPGAGALAGRGWWRVGRFLAGSIEKFWQDYDLERLRDDLQRAGLEGVHIETLSLGAGLVACGTKTDPARPTGRTRRATAHPGTPRASVAKTTTNGTRE